MHLSGAEFDGPLAQRGIGVIAPFDLALERELWRWAPLEVSLHLARTPYEPVPVSLEMAELVSEPRHLQAATRDVLGVEPEVVAYLCASGSFVHGLAREAELREAILAAGAQAAVTTSGALAEAVRELALTRISVMTPYDADLTDRLVAFLAELDVHVLRSHHLGLGGGIWKVNYRTVAELILAADDPASSTPAGVDLPVAHVHGTDLHAVAELVDLGNPQRLAEGAAALSAHRPDAVMWACTSGSFVHGPDGAQAQADALSRAAGTPAASTSQAFVAGLAALGVARVTVAASYPRDIADLFAAYLTAAGAEVVATSSAGIATGAQVGELSPGQVRHLVTAHDHPAAEAVLVPDTAMRTLGLVAELETRLGKPVLTANQVTVWHGLRLAGAGPVSPRLGTLFTTRRQDHAHQ